MRFPIRILAVALLGTAVGSADAQALRLLEKLTEVMARQEGKALSREFTEQGAALLKRPVVLKEMEEAAGLLSRPMAGTSEEVLFGRFQRLPGVSNALAAEFRTLPVAERRLVVEMGEGVHKVLRCYPEDGVSLLQRLDAAGLAQARTYGDFVVDGTHWLHTDEVLMAMRGTPLAGEESEAVARLLALKALPKVLEVQHVAPLWKAAVRRGGAGAATFWKYCVWPHKEKWLAAGLLTTYLAMPEKFHDAVGKLTEYAARKLAGLGIAVTTSAAHALVDSPVATLKGRYAREPLTTVFGLVLAGGLLLLAIGPVRRFLWRTITRRSGMRADKSINTARGFQSHQPLRE